MKVVSLGCRTDLALLVAGGSEVEDRGDHLVVRSPHDPTHWWANFLLLERAPAAAEAARWLERFAATFPDAGHVACSVDGTQGRVADLDPWAAAGLVVEAQAVMTASGVRTPRRRSDAVCRALVSDEDWAQSVELRVRCSDGREEPAAFRAYATGWSAGWACSQPVPASRDSSRWRWWPTRVRRDRALPVARLRRGGDAAAGGAAARLAGVRGGEQADGAASVAAVRAGPCGGPGRCVVPPHAAGGIASMPLRAAPGLASCDVRGGGRRSA